MSADEDRDVLIVLVPALVVTLRQAEDRKGSPLTESEVLALTDNAPFIALPEAEAEAFSAARGYSDIDPGRCWQDWQAGPVAAELGDFTSGPVFPG